MPDEQWPASINAGAGEDARYSLAAFRESHGFLIERHLDLLSRHLARIDIHVQMLLDTLREGERAGGDTEDFLRAYLLLGSKIVHHFESFHGLVTLGRYGDAAVVLRTALSDVQVLSYLGAFPDEIPDWFEASRIRSQPWVRGSRRQRLADQFSERRIRKKLEAKGLYPQAELYSDLSEAAHGSLWGIQFYAHRDEDGVASTHHAGLYAPLQAMLVCELALALAPEPLAVLLDWAIDLGGWGWLDRFAARFTAEREATYVLLDATIDLLDIADGFAVDEEPTREGMLRLFEEFKAKTGRYPGDPRDGKSR